eukprot:3351276-Pleurochrysis_carterae.AAC.4
MHAANAQASATCRACDWKMRKCQSEAQRRQFMRSVNIFVVRVVLVLIHFVLPAVLKRHPGVGKKAFRRIQALVGLWKTLRSFTFQKHP